MPFLPRNPEHHTEAVHAMYHTSLEHPFSDTVHLVYADAMDDAGAHEEAHTLRRLVKLRAAIGSKPVVIPYAGMPVTWTKDRVVGTNQAAIPEQSMYGFANTDRPNIRLPDAVLAKRRIRAGTREPGIAEDTHTDRRLLLVPETGGAAVLHGSVTKYYRPRDKKHTGNGPTYYSRTFLHSTDVKHLLGETDAQ